MKRISYLAQFLSGLVVSVADSAGIAATKEPARVAASMRVVLTSMMFSECKIDE